MVAGRWLLVLNLCPTPPCQVGDRVCGGGGPPPALWTGLPARTHHDAGPVAGEVEVGSAPTRVAARGPARDVWSAPSQGFISGLGLPAGGHAGCHQNLAGHAGENGPGRESRPPWLTTKPTPPPPPLNQITGEQVSGAAAGDSAAAAEVRGPHASLAVRLVQRDPGRAFVLGERLPYVLLAGAPKQDDASEDPATAARSGARADYLLYWNNKLVRPLSEMLGHCMPPARVQVCLWGWGEGVGARGLTRGVGQQGLGVPGSTWQRSRMDCWGAGLTARVCICGEAQGGLHRGSDPPTTSLTFCRR